MRLAAQIRVGTRRAPSVPGEIQGQRRCHANGAAALHDTDRHRNGHENEDTRGLRPLHRDAAASEMLVSVKTLYPRWGLSTGTDGIGGR